MRSMLLIPAVLITLFISIRVQAGTHGPLEYAVLEDQVVIVGCAPDVTEVVIPESIEGLPVKIIDAWAFAGQTNLTNVTFPDSLSSIWYSAFAGCSNLTAVNWGQHQDLSILGGAFKDCTGLSSFTFESHVYASQSLHDIFEGCTNLSFVDISPDHPYMTSIDGVVYDKEVQWLTYIPPAFEGVYSLPDSVEYRQLSGLSVCPNVTEIRVSESNPNYSSVNGILYDKSGKILVRVPPGFSGRLVIPDGVTYISSDLLIYGSYTNWAFAGCRNLTSIFIPSSVEKVGVQLGSRQGEHFGEPFRACNSLERIDVDPANARYASVDGVLFTKSLQTLLQLPPGYSGAYTIPGTTTSTYYSAFYDCEKLTRLTIGKDVSSLSAGPFYFPNPFMYCRSLSYIEVDADNPDYASMDGVVFDKDVDTLLIVPAGISGHYTVPRGITTIGDYAFWGCTKLTSIEISNSVESIGNGAFSHCSQLNNLVIPDSVTELGSSVFSDCESLSSITIGSGISVIPWYAFDACIRLRSVSLPETITAISEGAFNNCENLENVELPDSLTRIGTFAFQGCRKLMDLQIPDVAVSIESGAFLFCTGLMTVSLGNSLTALGGDDETYASNIFAGCRNLRSLTIPATVKTIGPGTFDYCYSLERLFFLGAPPVADYAPFADTHPDLVAYYVEGTPGWDAAYADLPTRPFPYIAQWGSFTPVPDPNGIFVDTGDWLGWLDITSRPWTWSYQTASWFYLTEPVATARRGWVFLPDLALEAPGAWIYMKEGTSYGWSYSLAKWLYIPPESIQASKGWVFII